MIIIPETENTVNEIQVKNHVSNKKTLYDAQSFFINLLIYLFNKNFPTVAQLAIQTPHQPINIAVVTMKNPPFKYENIASLYFHRILMRKSLKKLIRNVIIYY